MTDEPTPTDAANSEDETPPQAVPVAPPAEPEEAPPVGTAVEAQDLADAQAQEQQNNREQAELVAPPPQAMEAVTPQAPPMAQPVAIPVAPPAEPAPPPAPAPAGEWWVCTNEEGSARTVTAEKGMCPAFLVDLSSWPTGQLVGCPTCGGTVVRQALPGEAPAAVS